MGRKKMIWKTDVWVKWVGEGRSAVYIAGPRENHLDGQNHSHSIDTASAKHRVSLNSFQD